MREMIEGNTSYCLNKEHNLIAFVGQQYRPVAWFLDGGGVRFNWSNFSAKEIWKHRRNEFLGGSGGMLLGEIFLKNRLSGKPFRAF